MFFVFLRNLIIIECVEECPTNNCNGEGENPHCLNQQGWGCVECEIGYWKESHNYPCVLCDIIPHCDECGDFAGCIDCAPGYKKRWDTSCGYGISICIEDV